MVLVYTDKRAAHTSNGAAEYSVLGSFASSRASCIMRLTAGVVMSLQCEGWLDVNLTRVVLVKQRRDSHGNKQETRIGVGEQKEEVVVVVVF